MKSPRPTPLDLAIVAGVLLAAAQAFSNPTQVAP